MFLRVATLAALLSVSVYAQAPAKAPAASGAELPDARTIVGRAAIMAHKSMHATGTLSVPASGLSGPVDVYGAAPNMALVKASIAGIGEITDGFNGTHAWTISPMTGPALKTGKELEQTKI